MKIFKTCVHQHYRTISVFLLILSILFMSLAVQDTWALDRSKKNEGADHEDAHASATGKSVRVGVIEVEEKTGGRGVIESGAKKHHLGSRLKENLWFDNLAPPLSGDPVPPAGDFNKDSEHATLVADVIGSGDATHTGVAKKADIYVGSVEAKFVDWGGGNEVAGVRAAADWLEQGYDVHLFNHSWENGDTRDTRFLDWFTVQRDTLHIIAAGNSSGTLNDPATAFNALTVGATDDNFVNRADYSDYQAGGRAKPDLVAPGTKISNGAIEENGTSFAAPHVTGVAAMLAEKGLTMGTGNDKNRLAQRAIIMNSTRKRHIVKPDIDHADVRDNATTAIETEDGDYLTGKKIRQGSTATAPKTDQWTPSQWTSPDGKKLTVTQPLDDETGTGTLDAQRALIQFNGGEQKEKHFNPAGVGPIGWNRSFLNPDFGMDIYEFNFGIETGTFITATLVWDRPVNETDAGTAGSKPGQVDAGDTYAYGALPDFNLFVFKNEMLWAESIGTLDTVEHLHFPVPEFGKPFEYSLRVDLLGSGFNNINYGLAWWTTPIPEPETFFLFALGIIGLLLMHKRRAGKSCGSSR
ncbi:MAG: hypothetical protein BA864_07250 [Desulfuromonadales bacterium C00003093]|nr:MAG: hypothetical protein BA864_07250 [Desulfuromonadales bacterium C00003093]